MTLAVSYQKAALSRESSPPRVSIGMPAYNAEMFIESAIECVLAQTLADFELIISDNASTDRTIAICERYVAQDRRICLLQSMTNVGAHTNYRKVALAARAPFFKWASANDLLAPDYLEHCVAVLDRRPDVVLAFGSTRLFEHDPDASTAYDDGLNLQDDDAFVRFRRCVEQLRLNNIVNGVVRLDTLRATSLMPDYRGADNVVLAELALAGKFVEVPATHFYRRMSRESATRLQGTQEVMRHLYGGRKEKLFQSWRLTRGYVRAVMNSDVPTLARLRGFAYLLRQTYWRAPDLAADVRDALATCLARSRH